MKTTIAVLLTILSGAFHPTGAAEKWSGKFTARTVDEDGKPIGGIHITAGFGGGERFQGGTDTNGEFIVEDSNVRDREAGFFAGNNGYYESHVRLDFPTVQNGRCQPWNPMVTAVVRRVINPIPMYVKKVETIMPVLDEYVGYDLMKGDWIAPYGKGEAADFRFQMKNNFTDIDHFAISLELILTNAVDGIQEVSLSPFSCSAYRLARLAPVDGYTTTLHVAESSTNYFKPNLDQSFLFRVRSVTNSEGKLISAYYGKIRGYIGLDGRWSKTGSIQFIYYLNPTPNDRNLEFDPKRNLFTNLKSTEQVTAP